MFGATGKMYRHRLQSACVTALDVLLCNAPCVAKVESSTTCWPACQLEGQHIHSGQLAFPPDLANLVKLIQHKLSGFMDP